MTAMLELLNQATHVSVNTGLQEDALMAISSLINLLGENFTKYMDSFMPYLFAALNNYQVLFFSYFRKVSTNLKILFIISKGVSSL